MPEYIIPGNGRIGGNWMSALLNYIAVVYIIIGAAWRVKCYDCGFTVDKGNRVRHDAQVNWNEAVKV